MSSFLFKQLYENSKQLLKPSSSSLTDLPSIDRGLDQIDTESKLLHDKTKSLTYDPYIKAHCFLAQGGVNHQEISEVLKKLDTTHTFERRDDLVGANIDKYLERSYESTMKEAFETENELLQDFSGNFVKVDKDWNTMAQTCMETWDQQQTPKVINTTETNKAKIYTNRTTHSDNNGNEKGIRQSLDLAKIIQKLNDCRLDGTKIDLISEMKTSLLLPSSRIPSSPSTTTGPRSPSNETEDAQQVLHYMTNQYDSIKGNLSWTLYDTHLDTKLLETQVSLIHIARTHLEKEYIRYIDVALYKHAKLVKGGGNPSFIARLKSYINLTFKKYNTWMGPQLEIVNDFPIWVCLYLLIRTGHISLAVSYVNDNFTCFQSRSPNFVRYFLEYTTNPTHTLHRTDSIAILAEYEEMKYGNDIVDPYKMLLYKIIGRCEVKKGSPSILRSSEDYLWLQLSLIRLPAVQEEYLNERYTLQDLQETINADGPSRYNHNGTNHMLYFKILLLTLQFEKAISYLYQFEHSRVAAVHYAIVLAYHGLLRIPRDPIAPEAELISTVNHQTTFNFARLIHEYVKTAFVDQQQHNKKDDINSKDLEQAALHYTYLITLYPEEPMKRLSYCCIQNLVLAFLHDESILGTISTNQGRQVGSIDRYRRLLGIQDEMAYSTHILHPIGERLVKKGRYADAIHVYQLSNDDSKVIDVLIKELGDILAKTLKDIISAKKANGRHQQDTTHRNQQVSLIDMAQRTLQHSDTHLVKGVDNGKKHLIRAFILLFKGAWFYEENKYEEALWAIQNTGVLPLEENMPPGHHQTDKHENDALYTLMPDLILVTGDILYHIWLSLTDNPHYRASLMPHIHQIKQQVRNLIVFVGLTPTKTPAETTLHLKNIDDKMMILDEKRFI
ncbi:Nup93/Nic96-domain-containing protein [Chlamydoabsidia padenii]|nr:Nup93/Nic96-domain-containing protein [Chlamydoabsidia padenii]